MNARVAAAEHPDRSLIRSLNDRIDAALEGLIPRDRPYALLDFPHAPNVGDSLIWLGEVAWFARHGYPPPCYTCSNHTYSPELLRRRIGDGTIVLSGGGNFGDLYPPHQELREAVLEQFHDHPIVQLPQTIHFESAAAREAAAARVAAHGRVTVLARDEDSLETALAFGAVARLCPDMAFVLGELPWRRPARGGTLWMHRQDKESATDPEPGPPEGVRMIEWIEDWNTPTLAFYMLLARQLRYRPGLRPALQPLLSSTYTPVARQRVQRGMRILGGGAYVMTDRLHGHILAILMGIPHAVLDNVYGKVRRFHACWTSGSRLAEWCDTESQALARARAHGGATRPAFA